MTCIVRYDNYRSQKWQIWPQSINQRIKFDRIGKTVKMNNAYPSAVHPYVFHLTRPCNIIDCYESHDEKVRSLRNRCISILASHAKQKKLISNDRLYNVNRDAGKLVKSGREWRGAQRRRKDLRPGHTGVIFKLSGTIMPWSGELAGSHFCFLAG